MFNVKLRKKVTLINENGFHDPVQLPLTSAAELYAKQNIFILLSYTSLNVTTLTLFSAKLTLVKILGLVSKMVSYS